MKDNPRSTIYSKLLAQNPRRDNFVQTQNMPPDIVSIDIDGTLLYANTINAEFFIVLLFCKKNNIPVYLTSARTYYSALKNMSSEGAYFNRANGISGYSIDYLVGFIKAMFDLDVTVITYASADCDEGIPGSFYEKHHKIFEQAIVSGATGSASYNNFMKNCDEIQATIATRHGSKKIAELHSRGKIKSHLLTYLQKSNRGKTIFHIDSCRAAREEFKHDKICLGISNMEWHYLPFDKKNRASSLIQLAKRLDLSVFADRILQNLMSDVEQLVLLNYNSCFPTEVFISSNTRIYENLRVEYMSRPFILQANTLLSILRKFIQHENFISLPNVQALWGDIASAKCLHTVIETLDAFLNLRCFFGQEAVDDYYQTVRDCFDTYIKLINGPGFPAAEILHNMLGEEAADLLISDKIHNHTMSIG